MSVPSPSPQCRAALLCALIETVQDHELTVPVVQKVKERLLYYISFQADLLDNEIDRKTLLRCKKLLHEGEDISQLFCL